MIHYLLLLLLLYIPLPSLQPMNPSPSLECFWRKIRWERILFPTLNPAKFPCNRKSDDERRPIDAIQLPAILESSKSLMYYVHPKNQLNGEKKAMNSFQSWKMKQLIDDQKHALVWGGNDTVRNRREIARRVNFGGFGEIKQNLLETRKMKFLSIRIH